MRAKQGDADAFRDIVRRYQRPLFRFMYDFTNHREDAEELTQEVLLKLYRHIHRYDPKKSFSAWLFTIAQHTAYDRLRERQRKKESFDIDRADHPLPVPDVRPAIQDAGERIGKYIDVAQALHALPLHYRDVVHLYYWKERNYREISEALGIPLNTVKTRLKRAKIRLRQALAEEYTS